MTIRLADAGDGPKLGRLFAAVPMEGALALSVRRDPDFFAFYDMQEGITECYVAEHDEHGVIGAGTYMARSGYLDGSPATIGYLGDLRTAPPARGTGLLAAIYGPVFESFALRHGVDVFYTAIIASNRPALAALTGPRAAERGMPPYQLSSRFDIRAVHFMFPRRRRRHAYSVRSAHVGDAEEISNVLDRDARRRPFGYCFSDGLLERRLRSWPNLAIEDFLVASDRDGSIVGCLAPWSAAAVKRTHVVAYRGRMRMVRRGYNAAAMVGGFTPLPRPGRELRYLYATHLAVPDDDPAVLAALLEGAYHRHRSSGNAFLSCCAVRGDDLDQAYDTFSVTNLPAHLYAVTLPGTVAPASVTNGDRAGCEMALI